MNGRRLLEILNSLPDEDLDLPVRVFADHGQVAMSCNGAGTEYIEGDTYMAELLHPDYADENSPKVILISD